MKNLDEQRYDNNGQFYFHIILIMFIAIVKAYVFGKLEFLLILRNSAEGPHKVGHGVVMSDQVIAVARKNLIYGQTRRNAIH